MKRPAVVFAIALFVGALPIAFAQTPSDRSSIDACLAAARHARPTRFKSSPRRSRRLQLEIDAATCFDPTLSPAAAHLIGTVNADLARLARDVLVGSRSLARIVLPVKTASASSPNCWPIRSSRTRCWLATRTVISCPIAGPCPKTPAGTPTDARGCPIAVRPGANDERDERNFRATLSGSRTLYNKSCKDAPRPDIPSPLEWGRGAQTKLGSMGFNLAVAKIGGQPAGCEIFYEIQFRFIDPNPGNPALPPAKSSRSSSARRRICSPIRCARSSACPWDRWPCRRRAMSCGRRS